MKKQFGEYYLAFDIGTDSVGWAVTDLNYNLERLNGKYMWGTRLFEAGLRLSADRSERQGEGCSAELKESDCCRKYLQKK